MNYIFRGNLCGRLCGDCVEPLSQVTILFYRVRDQKQVAALAVADPKETFAVLDGEAVSAKADALLAEVRSDGSGNFEVVLEDDQDYQGEPFEIDVRLSNVPRRGKEAADASEPVQFTVTTVQPRWRETNQGYIAAWEYCLPYRYWCGIRALLDAWVICGHVVDCETQSPVSGVKVTALDKDWIQDDVVGTAVTDGTGHFRIDYTSIDFRQTPLSPPFFWEVVSGPDLYFKVETTSGIVLLEEPRSRGKQPDRENVGHCFCVELCLNDPPPPLEDYPHFTHIGDFNISTDIDPVSNLTNKGKFGHSDPNFGFFNAIKLKGYCPKVSPTDPSKVMHYRFLYIDPDSSLEKPVTDGLVYEHGVLVGVRKISWSVPGGEAYQDIIIMGNGTPSAPDSVPTPAPGELYPPPHVLIPDADGWIRVDQKAIDGGFYGPLMRLDTRKIASLVFGTPPSPGASNDPAGVAKNGKRLTIIYETATNPSDSTTIVRQTIQARILVNNWLEVRDLAIQDFSGCNPLSSPLKVDYTTDHEQLKSWKLWATSAAISPTTFASGTLPRGSFGTHLEDISSWPSCSYSVHLNVVRSLTDGEIDDDGRTTTITFCK